MDDSEPTLTTTDATPKPTLDVPARLELGCFALLILGLCPLNGPAMTLVQLIGSMWGDETWTLVDAGEVSVGPGRQVAWEREEGRYAGFLMCRFRTRLTVLARGEILARGEVIAEYDDCGWSQTIDALHDGRVVAAVGDVLLVEASETLAHAASNDASAWRWAIESDEMVHAGLAARAYRTLRQDHPALADRVMDARILRRSREWPAALFALCGARRDGGPVGEDVRRVCGARLHPRDTGAGATAP